MTVDDGGYRTGGFWRISDRSGRKVRADQTRMEWTGAIVADDEFEERHPQDSVRGLADTQIVPDPRPPPPVDTFIGPLVTELTVAAAAGATTVNVISSVRMRVGDVCSIPLDNGTLYRGTVSNVDVSTQIVFTTPLPYSAAIGTIVADNTAMAAADIG